MNLIEAIKARHSVRKYTDRPIAPAAVTILNETAGRLNRRFGLNVQLALEEPSALLPVFGNTERFHRGLACRMQIWQK